MLSGLMFHLNISYLKREKWSVKEETCWKTFFFKSKTIPLVLEKKNLKKMLFIENNFDFFFFEICTDIDVLSLYICHEILIRISKKCLSWKSNLIWQDANHQPSHTLHLSMTQVAPLRVSYLQRIYLRMCQLFRIKISSWFFRSGHKCMQVEANRVEETLRVLSLML